MGFTLQPVYEALRRVLPSPVLASVVIVLTAGHLIVGVVVGFISLFVSRGAALTATLVASLGPGGTANGWIQAATGWLGRFGFSPENLSERLRGALTEIASRSAAVAGALASVTASSLLALFFALLTLHVVLLHWDQMVAKLEVLSPLRREYTRLLLAEFRLVGRATLLGTAATGAAQGVFATLGFWATGIPDPLFFGIATAIASLVPAVGTLLVWVPAGLYLIATGHSTMGVLLLAWGALVIVGVSDYVIRPRLVGDETMPALLIFLALFGGVEVLGLRGLIIGPVVMALAVAVLRLYAREAEATKASAARAAAR
jgi:predicted PurR-regulated permease PerM